MNYKKLNFNQIFLNRVNLDVKDHLDPLVYLVLRVLEDQEDLKVDEALQDLLEYLDLKDKKEELELMDPQAPWVFLDLQVLLVTEVHLDYLDQLVLLELEEQQVHKENVVTLDGKVKKVLLGLQVYQVHLAPLVQEEKEVKKVPWVNLEHLVLEEGLETKDRLAQLEQWDHLEVLVYL